MKKGRGRRGTVGSLLPPMIEVGFEPTKHYVVDLKSTPFDRSGTQPKQGTYGSPHPSLFIRRGFLRPNRDSNSG